MAARSCCSDKPVRYRVPAPAVRDGIAYVTEDRKVEGFFETMSIARNIYLGLLAKFPGGRAAAVAARGRQRRRDWIERLKVRAIGDDAKVVELSGGNQQKVVIAKSLVQEPDLIIFDEPTRGVDVGAIVEIHELINRLADEGKAVVVISSYLPEIMALSDRILVSRAGQGGGGILGAGGDRGEDHVCGDPLSGRRRGEEPLRRSNPGAGRCGAPRVEAANVASRRQDRVASLAMTIVASACRAPTKPAFTITPPPPPPAPAYSSTPAPASARLRATGMPLRAA